MRIIQTNCSVDYYGRGETHLCPGVRLVIIKNDNSISIHQDKGIGPMNYMSRSKIYREEENSEGIITIYAENNNENIKIKMYEIFQDLTMDLESDTKVSHVGTESDLQKWLSIEKNFKEIFSDDYKFLTREYQTTKGAVDLLAQNKNTKQLVLIECKRFAHKNDIFQLIRYKEAINKLYKEALNNNLEEILTSNGKYSYKVKREWLVKPELFLISSAAQKGLKEEAIEYNINVISIGRKWIKNLEK